MRRALFACVTLLLAAAAGFASCSEDAPPPKVIVAEPVEQTVARYFEAAGTTAAVNSVDLVARVEGFVQEISQVDGAFVKKGTLLFSIEPEPYSLRLETAKSSVARARAALALAEADFKRQAELITTHATSWSAYDKALEQVDSARADLQSAQAEEKAAEISLSYTRVTAPFDGIVTERKVSLGELVGNQNPTVLATIVQVDPIYVTFKVSEQEVLQIRADLMRQGHDPRASVGLGVEVGLQSESDNPHKGILDYTAPLLDPTAKTLAARAILANGDRVLLPGYSVRVRIPRRQEPALLVPDAVLASDQGGRYLLVVNKGGVVEQRRVQQGQPVGKLRVIEQGLTKDDRVIVGGMHVIPGQKVVAELSPMPAAN